jgi:PAS domain S-box-containing protein
MTEELRGHEAVWRDGTRTLASWPVASIVVRMVVVGLAYYASARLGLRYAVVGHNVTPLWPPTGIALVAFLVWGRRMWPGVAVAAFFVNEPITSTWAALLTTAGNTAAPVLAATLLDGAGFHHRIDRIRDAVLLVSLGALAAMTVSATVGTASLVISDQIHGNSVLGTWAAWWTGDAMGVLIVAPALLALETALRTSHATPTVGRTVEAGTLFVLLTSVALVSAHTYLGVEFLVLPFVAWAAWRFGQPGAAPAALVASSIITWGAARGIGQFAEGSLVERMLVLQAFNATVAVTSLVVAALMTERRQGRDALERATVDLELRVHLRTSELSSTNARLTREVAERMEAERKLRQRERQLAEAQHLAQLGSWEWRVPENAVTWSDEMYRIYGHEPRSFELTFEKAVEQVVPEDLERIRSNLARTLAPEADPVRPGVEFRIRRPDGAERVLFGRSTVQRGPDGQAVRIVGTVQDLTEEKEAEREHRIAETLQRSLLPEGLPQVSGVGLAARYVAASRGALVGGDWYDVIPLPDGRIGLAIGDVVGHGLRAAATMAQLRLSLRAYAVEDPAPTSVVGRLHDMVRRLLPAEMATLVYAVFDPDAEAVSFANAGHPAPLLVQPDGESAFLEPVASPPLGSAWHDGEVAEASASLRPGATLILVTDGLIERRGVSLLDGLARLRDAASAEPGQGLEALCERLVGSLLEPEVADDVAILVIRNQPRSTGPMRLEVPAEPSSLASIRAALRRWLRDVGVAALDSHDIVLAATEACSNVVLHAYGSGTGFIDVEAVSAEGDSAVQVTVRDRGTWRTQTSEGGGRGFLVMRGLMDEVQVDHAADGTVIRLRRRIRAQEPA